MASGVRDGMRTALGRVCKEAIYGRLKPISQLRFDHDTTTIRRCHDAFDYDGNDRNYDLRSIPMRYDYDKTTTKN